MLFVYNGPTCRGGGRDVGGWGGRGERGRENEREREGERKRKRKKERVRVRERKINQMYYTFLTSFPFLPQRDGLTMWNASKKMN